MLESYLTSAARHSSAVAVTFRYYYVDRRFRWFSRGVHARGEGAAKRLRKQEIPFCGRRLVQRPAETRWWKAT
jgi:hypothetical protein